MFIFVELLNVLVCVAASYFIVLGSAVCVDSLSAVHVFLVSL